MMLCCPRARAFMTVSMHAGEQTRRIQETSATSHLLMVLAKLTLIQKASQIWQSYFIRLVDVWHSGWLKYHD